MRDRDREKETRQGAPSVSHVTVLSSENCDRIQSLEKVPISLWRMVLKLLGMFMYIT